MKKIIRFGIFVIIASILSACTTIDPKAFKSNKTYAVVSTFLQDKIEVIPNMIGSRDLRWSGDKKSIQRALNTKDIANRFMVEYLKGFKSRIPMKVIYGSKVTSNPHYKKARSVDTRGGYRASFIPATGVPCVLGQ